MYTVATSCRPVGIWQDRLALDEYEDGGDRALLLSELNIPSKTLQIAVPNTHICVSANNSTNRLAQTKRIIFNPLSRLMLQHAVNSYSILCRRLSDEPQDGHS